MSLVVAGLTAVGTTMDNGSSLDTHLTGIVGAVALIALATVDLFAGGRTTGLRSSSPRSRQTA